MLAHRFKSKRHHRQYRLRYSLRGSGTRPRLCVFRSARHIYAQVIDDDSGRTLCAASTLEAGFKSFKGTKIEAAERIGETIVERAKAQGITRLVFDRNGFLYTGRVAAVSKAAHKAGLLSGDSKGTKAEKPAKAKAEKPAKAKAEKPAKAKAEKPAKAKAEKPAKAKAEKPAKAKAEKPAKAKAEKPAKAKAEKPAKAKKAAPKAAAKKPSKPAKAKADSKSDAKTEEKG